MGDIQGKLTFTPGISKSSIRERHSDILITSFFSALPLDSIISQLQNVMLLLPRMDAHRLSYVHTLAMAAGLRFQSSGQLGDLEQSILNFTEAVYLPLHRDASPSSPNIVQIFYYLALSVLFRIPVSRRPEDVKCCIRYFRYLHRQWREVSMKFPCPVTVFLVRALTVKVGLKLGDLDQDIEEMADLCDELLNSDISIQFLDQSITDFARAMNMHFNDPFEWQTPPKKAIDCLRKAIVRLPDLDKVSMVLARSLLNRFVITPSVDDYEEGMSILDGILTLRGSGGGPGPYREDALKQAAIFANVQFHVYGKPEHLENAIYRIHNMLDGCSIEDSIRAECIKRLSALEELRLGGTKNTHDALFPPPESAELPLLRDLIASGREAMAVKLDSKSHMKHLNALRAFTNKQLTDAANIEDGIKYCRCLLVSYPHSDLSFLAQMALCHLFNRAFQCTHNIGYLNEAISATRVGVDTSSAPHNRFPLLFNLISLLSTRLELLRHQEDLDELMQLFPIAADYHGVFPRSQSGLPISCEWATAARLFRHPSAPTAYDHAMSSVQATLAFAPTLDKQHSRLVATRSLHMIPLHYASYHIHTGHLKQAIETLERGRGLLWSEMRGLRTSIDRIRLANSILADKFSEVNRELETLTLAFSLNDNANGLNTIEGMDSYGHSVIRKQKLLGDREEIITQIRALSGFDTFLKPPSFDTLRSAASHGPVIIISHCEWRSDILILLHNSPPSLIPTSDDFYIRAKKLQDQLLAERKDPGSNAYDDALRAVLKELYELVGRPVIKRLNELNIPEQSRVWWCPTSVFCSLPLHAMGPIPSDGGPSQYFLDLYIPSYTPSLSALIDSHKPNSQIFEKPSVLLVSQPDEFMVRALDEMKAVQRASSRATTLIGATATPSAVLERLRDHRFVHIVCHGLLEPGKPFDSSFKLFQGKRLSLHAIVQSQLPNAEFAFLAACHTAELTDESPVDEALHLAAAMQYCGFRSVVGTMWAMADEDGRDLAENFYKSVFSGRKQGVPYHEITAEALRDAVVRLRRRRMTLERWVNYVHYGA